MRWRRLLAAAAGGAALWLFGVWPPPVWWRTHWPEQSAMMRRAPASRAQPAPSHRPAGARYDPTPLADIAPILQRLVILAEDSRFRTHCGIDPAEIADAIGLAPDAGLRETLATVWRRRDRIRGASTITQQLAKNLYLSPTRNPLRKVKEMATAFRLEAALSKDRILELYLNLAELGSGVWGVTAASGAYFGVRPRQLTIDQAASLAATLPHPRSSNPAYRPARMLARRGLILARYHGADVTIPRSDELAAAIDSIVPPTIDLPLVPPLLDSLFDSVRVAPPGPDTTGAPRDTAPS
ncbi:MAG TPA: biosynthetic peptidoglycan transglycosylase [Gemmatimonadales bacterium]|jgi:monofunctional biosynthetic peptidoglycan transglycosylase|nr:biosynthetic peptidoglycan transglycosylase [Gemmatimonadales bacterium]